MSDDVIHREYMPLFEVEDNYRKVVISLDCMPIGARVGIEWLNIIEFIRTIE